MTASSLLRQHPLLAIAQPGVSNTLFAIDALARASLTSQAPPAADEPAGTLFRISDSATPLPDDLQAHYTLLVRAFRDTDEDKIQDLSLPGSVRFRGGFPYNGYGSWERASLPGDINPQFARDTGSYGFSADILTVTRHSDDAYQLRTRTSQLSFVRTANSGWKLYAYFDRPLKYDKAARK